MRREDVTKEYLLELALVVSEAKDPSFSLFPFLIGKEFHSSDFIQLMEIEVKVPFEIVEPEIFFSSVGGVVNSEKKTTTLCYL